MIERIRKHTMESNHPPASDDEPHSQITSFPHASRTALRQAARAWIKRGYAIVYEDDHLVELAREDKAPRPWLIALGVVGGIVAGLAIIGATLIWLRARPWRIVSLAASPEHKVVTHAYRSRLAPDSQES
jgi:hypothetical protein